MFPLCLPVHFKEITEDEENDLITEDETNFYSCEEGQDDPMNRGGVLDTWISSDTIRYPSLSVLMRGRGTSGINN